MVHILLVASGYVIPQNVRLIVWYKHNLGFVLGDIDVGGNRTVYTKMDHILCYYDRKGMLLAHVKS